jgi:2,3-bisphosphoglycerate-independent phosphoglycerate mutase
MVQSILENKGITLKKETMGALPGNIILTNQKCDVNRILRKEWVG